MFEKLDAQWKALCRARPKTLAASLFVFATAMLFVYLHIRGYPEFAAWIIAAVLLPVPFEIWPIWRSGRGKSNRSTTK